MSGTICSARTACVGWIGSASPGRHRRREHRDSIVEAPHAELAVCATAREREDA
jgi:hypothetical protein